MKIELTESFQASLRMRSQEERARVFEAMIALPKACQAPHAHSGLGLRKLHGREIWEIRVGLNLRIAFRLEPNKAVLELLGTHDEIRQYVKGEKCREYQPSGPFSGIV